MTLRSDTYAAPPLTKRSDCPNRTQGAMLSHCCKLVDIASTRSVNCSSSRTVPSFLCGRGQLLSLRTNWQHLHVHPFSKYRQNALRELHLAWRPAFCLEDYWRSDQNAKAPSASLATKASHAGSRSVNEYHVKWRLVRRDKTVEHYVAMSDVPKS
jgi:hypothetical protein